MDVDDIPTTEEFLAICYQCKLSPQDMDEMTYGDIIDYIDAYIELQDPNKEHVRKGTQSDIKAFFG